MPGFHPVEVNVALTRRKTSTDRANVCSTAADNFLHRILEQSTLRSLRTLSACKDETVDCLDVLKLQLLTSLSCGLLWSFTTTTGDRLLLALMTSIHQLAASDDALSVGFSVWSFNK
jgi:hypothetical protein